MTEVKDKVRFGIKLWILFIVLLPLKLMCVNDFFCELSWWWVTAPLWITYALVLLLVAVFFVAMIFIVAALALDLVLKRK